MSGGFSPGGLSHDRGLAAPVAQANHPDESVKEPTAVGSGGAAGTVDALATKAAIDTLGAAATPSTRPWRRPACSA